MCVLGVFGGIKGEERAIEERGEGIGMEALKGFGKPPERWRL